MNIEKTFVFELEDIEIMFSHGDKILITEVSFLIPKQLKELPIIVKYNCVVGFCDLGDKFQSNCPRFFQSVCCCSSTTNIIHIICINDDTF